MQNSTKRALIVGIVVIVAVVGLVVFVSAGQNNMSSQQSSSQSTSDAVAADTVAIEDYAYKAPAIKVKKGTTVTWTNNDTVRHSVTTADGAQDMFDSKLFGKGETYKHTFNKTGTYNYYCTPHPYMKGVVVVTD